MAMTVIYGALLVLFAILGAFGLRQNHSPTALVVFATGLLATARTFVQSLAQTSLPVYFFVQRLKLRVASDTTSRWWFAARYDGEWAEDASAAICQTLGKQFRLPVRIERKSNREITVEVDSTLHVTVTVTPASMSPFGKQHVDVISKTIEVSYGHARKKLDSQIIPFLAEVERILRPDSSSFELNVEFGRDNPFFAVYIAHLSPDQVGDFRVVLHVDANHPSGSAEKVEISRRELHVTALSTMSFKKLAEDFILLSPDTKLLAGVK